MKRCNSEVLKYLKGRTCHSSTDSLVVGIHWWWGIRGGEFVGGGESVDGGECIGSGGFAGSGGFVAIELKM